MGVILIIESDLNKAFFELLIEKYRVPRPTIDLEGKTIQRVLQIQYPNEEFRSGAVAIFNDNTCFYIPKILEINKSSKKYEGLSYREYLRIFKDLFPNAYEDYCNFQKNLWDKENEKRELREYRRLKKKFECSPGN